MKEQIKMKNWTPVVVLVLGTLILGSSPLLADDSEGPRTIRGIELPNPVGLGVTFYSQNQPYETESMAVQYPGVDQGLLQNLNIENETTTFHLRLDYWVLPFLNVFGLGGNIDSSTRIELSQVELGLPITLDDLIVNLDGTMFGLGGVLAFGGKKWFGTVAYQLTETNLKESDSAVSAWVLTPKVGRRFNGGAGWIGGMYQQAQEEHNGIFDMPGIGDIPYEVKLREQQPWNVVAGATYGITRHWIVTAQAGFGERVSALGMFEYRF